MRRASWCWALVVLAVVVSCNGCMVTRAAFGEMVTTTHEQPLWHVPLLLFGWPFTLACDVVLFPFEVLLGMIWRSGAI